MSIDKTGTVNTIQQLNAEEVCGALEIIDPTPRGVRYVRTPDGQTALQVANRYTRGTTGGVIWVNVPTVDVDWDGNELEVPL